MPTVPQLEQQGQALFLEQKNLVEDETRPWSEKRDEFDKREADIAAIIEQRNALKAIDGNPFEKLGDDKPADAPDLTAKSIGEQVVNDPGYADLKSWSPGSSRFSKTFEAKAATITETGGGIGGVIPTYLPGVIATRFRRLTVSDLMPQGSMSSKSLIYVQETAVTNAAATVAEGGTKPLSDITLAQVTETASKIANISKISDEMLQDVNYIASYVNGRLVLFVQLAEEDQLLNGDGTGANLTGLLNRSNLATAQAVGSDVRPDAIFKQITNIRATSFLDPDGIVMHPTDWQTIRLLKDGNEQYYGGGPFTGAYGNGSASNDQGNLAGGTELWNCRVVVTPAIAQGTALVGAFEMATQVFRRTGITVEMTNSNEDDFKKNLVAIRAEERLALAVYRPGALGKVTGL